MKLKVRNCVDEPLSGTNQSGIWHTEWQTVQDGTDLASIMGLALSQGGTVSEQCIILFSSVSGKNFRKRSHITINNYKIMILKLILFLGDKKTNIYVSDYVSQSTLKTAKKCKILFLVCSFVPVFKDSEVVEILLILCNLHQVSTHNCLFFF